jgi:uroporphyrinogen-III synthase
MPEQRILILSTKPLEAGLVEEAAAKGITIEAMPFISIHPIGDETVQQGLRELTGKKLVAVFTSVHAVEEVGRAMGYELRAMSGESTGASDKLRASGEGLETGSERKADGTIPWTIFCIGGATGRLVRQYFGEGCVAGEAGSAAALAEVMVEKLGAASHEREEGEGPIREIFFFCGDRRREELPHRLEQASIRVHEWIVYQTSPSPQRIGKEYRAILFFSPSGVHSFFSVNETPKDTLFFAIGETTAEAIRGYTASPVIVAPAPDKTAMIRQMIDHFCI